VEFQLITCEYLLIEDRRQFMDNIEEGNEVFARKEEQKEMG